MIKKDIVKNNDDKFHWKNPYRVKRSHNTVKNTKLPLRDTVQKQQLEPTTSTPDLLQVMSNFKDGVKGISSSVQQFEKTMESLTQLYQTIDKLGGIKKLNQFISPASSRSPSRTSSEFGNVFGQLKSFVSILEKVDFNQINQFLGTPMIQGMVNNEQNEK